MTEKVKLTQEVADAIDYALNKGRYNHESLILSHAETELQDNPWTQAYKLLNEISLLTLVDALRIGYEVEREYKVGDWVFNLKAERLAQIDHRGITGDYVWVADEEFNFFHTGDTRLATPEEIKAEQERRVWAGIDRKPYEVKDDDVMIIREGRHDNSLQVKDFDKRELHQMMRSGDIIGFYPAESFISFEEVDSNA